ncbi:unnamed protein product [Schistosoma margrebowiei]|uniref:Uncharacterized protein n=1 Tax=Schistosoma margrebowiei TaxID=48269 RepID=A0A183MJG4_9TREM|nr:unnamed protein product [Schistosoma margrebowiei]
MRGRKANVRRFNRNPNQWCTWAPVSCGNKWRMNQLLVTGFHGTASPYDAPLPCGSDPQVKGSGYVTPNMFTNDVSEPYEILKRSILKRGDLTGRKRLGQLLIKIDVQHGSATDMLQRMREVIVQRTFDDGLSKLPQQVQAELVSFENNTLSESAASVGRILEIKRSNAKVFSVKEKPQTTHNDITELCHTLHVCDMSLDHERQIATTGASIITSMESLPGIVENPASFSTQNPPTQKTSRETSTSARVNSNRNRLFRSVLFGPRRFRFPSGFQASECYEMQFDYFLNICPIQFQCLS